MNDPNIFAKRRLGRIVAEEAARHHGDEEATLRAVTAAVLSDPVLEKAAVSPGIGEMIPEELKARGCRQGPGGRWHVPGSPRDPGAA